MACGLVCLLIQCTTALLSTYLLFEKEKYQSTEPGSRATAGMENQGFFRTEGAFSRPVLRVQ
jgi:hypothetical protein